MDSPGSPLTNPAMEANSQHSSLPPHYLMWSTARDLQNCTVQILSFLTSPSPFSLRLLSCVAFRSYSSVYFFFHGCLFLSSISFNSEAVQCLLPFLHQAPVPGWMKVLATEAEVQMKAQAALCPPSCYGGHKGKRPLWLSPRQMAVLKLRALITIIIFSRTILQAAWLRAVQAPARGWVLRAEQEAASKSREKAVAAPPKLWDTIIYLFCTPREFPAMNVHEIWIQSGKALNFPLLEIKACVGSHCCFHWHVSVGIINIPLDVQLWCCKWETNQSMYFNL